MRYKIKLYLLGHYRHKGELFVLENTVMRKIDNIEKMRNIIENTGIEILKWKRNKKPYITIIVEGLENKKRLEKFLEKIRA